MNKNLVISGLALATIVGCAQREKAMVDLPLVTINGNVIRTPELENRLLMFICACEPCAKAGTRLSDKSQPIFLVSNLSNNDVNKWVINTGWKGQVLFDHGSAYALAHSLLPCPRLVRMNGGTPKEIELEEFLR